MLNPTAQLTIGGGKRLRSGMMCVMVFWVLGQGDWIQGRVKNQHGEDVLGKECSSAETGRHLERRLMTACLSKVSWIGLCCWPSAHAQAGRPQVEGSSRWVLGPTAHVGGLGGHRWRAPVARSLAPRGRPGRRPALSLAWPLQL